MRFTTIVSWLALGPTPSIPTWAFESLWEARRQGWLAPPEFNDDAQVVEAYRKGVAKGMLKVMAKMGISTLQSYKGAQIFEALGLGDEVIDFCFAGTSSQIQGVELRALGSGAAPFAPSGIPEARVMLMLHCPIQVNIIGGPEGKSGLGILPR